ncbi:MAG: diguanylate cyclase [Pseudomonadota bacterium]
MRIQSPRLEAVIVLPFTVVAVVLATALIGWSWRAGIAEAESAAFAVHAATAKRVATRLDALFDVPDRLLTYSLDAIRLGAVSVDDLHAMEQHFSSQARAFPNITNVAFGSADGHYSVAYRDWDSPNDVHVAEATPGGSMLSYRLAPDGSRSDLIDEYPAFRVTERPWFIAAANSQGATWFPVYAFHSGEALAIGMATPVRNSDGSLRGVLAADMALNEITRLLAELEIGDEGRAFLMESDGRLIADSSGRLPLREVDGELLRVSAMESDSTSIRLAADTALDSEALAAEGRVNESIQRGDRSYLVHLERYGRPGGLELTFGIGVPLDAYTARLVDDMRRRIAVAGVFVLVGLIMLMIVARGIGRTVDRLGRAAVGIAAGDWAAELPNSRIRELRSLSAAFGSMAGQLREILSGLEQRVDERTAELAEANRQLAELSRVDSLTGVGNRRAFDEAMAQEWARARREQRPLAVILCDVDQFKAYNDRYGHPEGDRCLIAIAGALTASARRTVDLVTRYGGEEFAVLLPDLGTDRAFEMAECFRQAVESLALPHEGSSHGHVTISVGFKCHVPAVGETAPGQLVASADVALYQAKARGRNQVVAADNQPSSADA